MRISTGTSLAEVAEYQATYGASSVLQALGQVAYLIVFPWDVPQDGGIDTSIFRDDLDEVDDDYDPLEETVVDEDTDAGVFSTTRAGGAAPTTSFDPGQAFLLPLVKSTRNPFEQLLTLGRARNNDVILDSPNVSKVHAWFLNGGPTGWYLQDNASTNGTVHNDTSAPPRTNLSLRIKDTLSFGGVQAVFADGATVLSMATQQT